MERTITIAYGDMLEHSKEVTINEKQSARKIMALFMRENKIKKLLHLNTNAGYKLVNAKTGEKIRKGSHIFYFTGDNVFLLLPDEDALTEPKHFYLALLWFFCLGLIVEIFVRIFTIYVGIDPELPGKIASTIVYFIVFIPAEIFKTKKCKRIKSQNDLLISSYSGRDKMYGNIIQPKKAAKAQEEVQNISEERNIDKYSDEDEEKTNLEADAADDCVENSADSAENPEESLLSDSPKALFCRRCGAKLIDGGSFCNKCGTKI